MGGGLVSYFKIENLSQKKIFSRTLDAGIL